MTTHKFIALAGLILTLALPVALMAGGVNGSDWYSTEAGKTTNKIELPIPYSTAVARSTIGMDWYDESDIIMTKRSISDRSFSTEAGIGIGMDWHSEQTTPVDSRKDCLSIAGNLNPGVDNC